MTEECQNCQRLEAENKQLRTQVKQLKEIIRWVLSQLRGLSRALSGIMHQAHKILRRRSGVKFPKWFRAEGRYAVAKFAYNQLAYIIAVIESHLSGI